METIKNINNGGVHIEKGNFHIGDNYINDLSLAYNQVYKEQIRNFETLLYGLKPITAKKLLIELEKNINEKESIENLVRSKIIYLKAECDNLLGVNKLEVSKDIIKAYSLNKVDSKLKEAAVIAYFHIEQFSKAKGLAAEILITDEFNSVALAITLLTNQTSSLSEQLDGLPKTVIQNEDFRRIIFYLSTKEQYSDFKFMIDKFKILLNLDDYVKTTALNYSNFKNIFFFVDSIISYFLEKHIIYLGYKKLEENSEIIKIQGILENFIKQLENTEVKYNEGYYMFFNAYFKYLINSDIENAERMLSCYHVITNKQEYNTLLLANVLQQVKRYDEAIQIITKLKTPLAYEIKMFCYLQKRDGIQYYNCVKEYLPTIKTLQTVNITHYLNIPKILYDFNLLNTIETNDFIKGKDFDTIELRKFVEIFINILKGDRSKEIELKLIGLINNDFLKNNIYYVFFAKCFDLLLNYNKCCELYEENVDLKIESKSLYEYLYYLKKSNIRHEYLLSLLKEWRENFSFEESLIQIELELRKVMYQWNEIIDCCEYLFKNNIVKEHYLANYALAINYCDKPDKNLKIQTILSLLPQIEFTILLNYKIIISTLENAKFYDELVELLYNKALNIGDSDARMGYFNFVSFKCKKYLIEYDIVEEGCFVEYKNNKNITQFECTTKSDFYDYFINKKVSDKILIDSKFSSKKSEIEIVKIMNKYLALYNDILVEVQTNPLSNIPLESFNVESYINGENGLTINDFFNELTNISGNKNNESYYNNYYSSKISFTEIALQMYSGNYVKAYYDLLKDRKGIKDISNNKLDNKTLLAYNEFILDFSSILFLFELNRLHNKSFSNLNLTISKSTFYIIKEYSNKDFPDMGQNYIIDKEFYNDLLKWINSNCKIKMSYSKCAFIEELNNNLDSLPWAHIVLDNYCLLIDCENTVLVTNDSIYNQLFQDFSIRMIDSKEFTDLYLSEN